MRSPSGSRWPAEGCGARPCFASSELLSKGPNDGKVLNNLAVAYEAVGQYDNALLAYKEALKADSTNRELKRNYSRFIEFYQAFKPAGEEPPCRPRGTTGDRGIWRSAVLSKWTVVSIRVAETGLESTNAFN